MRAFGSNDQTSAVRYIDYGSNEHRSTAFDVAGYFTAHPDLVGTIKIPIPI